MKKSEKLDQKMGEIDGVWIGREKRRKSEKDTEIKNNKKVASLGITLVTND